MFDSVSIKDAIISVYPVKNVKHNRLQYDFNVWMFQQGTINEHYKRYDPNVTNDLIDAYLHEMEARKHLETSNFTCKCFIAILIYTSTFT